MNQLLTFTKDEERNIHTITTLEIAEMMKMEHYEILKKLEGTTNPDGSVKQIGILPVLTKGNFPVSDYFIESSYKDASGKENKCYKVTKLGCDFLANKFTGEKGILFTAMYVKRFHDMEYYIESQNVKPSLPEATDAARLIKEVYEAAGVDPRYIAVSVNGIYKEIGLNLPLPIEMKEKKLYDQTEIAKELGIMSVSGNPHAQAVGIIISMLDISDDYKISTPYTNHGHSGVVVQYTENVLNEVREWLQIHSFPNFINGNNKRFKVCYS